MNDQSIPVYNWIFWTKQLITCVTSAASGKQHSIHFLIYKTTHPPERELTSTGFGEPPKCRMSLSLQDSSPLGNKRSNVAGLINTVTPVTSTHGAALHGISQNCRGFCLASLCRRNALILIVHTYLLHDKDIPENLTCYQWETCCLPWGTGIKPPKICPGLC